MRAKNPMKSWLLMGCVLLTGCETELTDDETSARLADEQLSTVLQRATATTSLQLRRTSDGRVAAASYRDHSPLFSFSGDDPRAALTAWARTNARMLGFDPADSTTDTLFGELELQRRIEAIAPTSTSPGLVMHRYAQRYRGYRVLGSDEAVTVSSNGNGGVLSIVGAFVDNRRELAGLRNPISREVAERTVLASVDGTAVLDSLELVAVTERGTLAWAAELHDATDPLYVLLSAETGAVLDSGRRSAESPSDHMPVFQVRSAAMVDDPGSVSEVNYPWLRGSTWNGSYTPVTGWRLRMGDDRMLVYDLAQENNAVPTVHLANQYLPNTQIPGSYFTATAAGNANTFNTQNLFHKTHEALLRLDALQSPFGWDHALGTPFGLFTPGPLNLITNIDTTPEPGEADYCKGHLGVFNACKISGAAIQPAHDGVMTSCIYTCTNRVGTLFHELGHYVDHHATRGTMSTGVQSSSCIPDTTDEAVALRETIGDMTALYLARKLYTGLPYDFSTTSNTCNFASIGMGTSAVHASNCVNSANQIGWFDDDRPSYSASKPCNYNAGYRMSSVNQAVWEYLNRRRCLVQAPFTCSSFRGGGGTPDDFMSGMIYALSLSNAQSYEMFFENIETYIWAARGAAEASMFHAILADHGILDP